MKTPEKIKKGMELCGVLDGDCENCPYDDGPQLLCVDRLRKDALAYIQQLESRLAQVERERDALLHDLRRADYVDCYACKHKNSGYDCDVDCTNCLNPCTCNSCHHNNKWEWRGVCEENTKEE